MADEHFATGDDTLLVGALDFLECSASRWTTKRDIVKLIERGRDRDAPDAGGYDDEQLLARLLDIERVARVQHNDDTFALDSAYDGAQPVLLQAARHGRRALARLMMSRGESATELADGMLTPVSPITAAYARNDMPMVRTLSRPPTLSADAQLGSLDRADAYVGADVDADVDANAHMLAAFEHERTDGANVEWLSRRTLFRALCASENKRGECSICCDCDDDDDGGGGEYTTVLEFNRAIQQLLFDVDVDVDADADADATSVATIADAADAGAVTPVAATATSTSPSADDEVGDAATKTKKKKAGDAGSAHDNSAASREPRKSDDAKPVSSDQVLARMYLRCWRRRVGARAALLADKQLGVDAADVDFHLFCQACGGRGRIVDDRGHELVDERGASTSYVHSVTGDTVDRDGWLLAHTVDPRFLPAANTLVELCGLRRTVTWNHRIAVYTGERLANGRLIVELEPTPDELRASAAPQRVSVLAENLRMLRRAAEARCTSCERVFCARCLLDAHAQHSCDGAVHQRTVVQGELASQRYVKSHSRPCPKCKTPTEHGGGCTHMTCRVCKHGWCWACSGDYISGCYSFDLTKCNCAAKRAKLEQDRAAAVERFAARAAAAAAAAAGNDDDDDIGLDLFA